MVCDRQMHRHAGMGYRNGYRDVMGIVPDIHIYRCDMPVTRDGTVFRIHIAGLAMWNSGIDYSCIVAEG